MQRRQIAVGCLKAVRLLIIKNGLKKERHLGTPRYKGGMERGAPGEGGRTTGLWSLAFVCWKHEPLGHLPLFYHLKILNTRCLPFTTRKAGSLVPCLFACPGQCLHSQVPDLPQLEERCVCGNSQSTLTHKKNTRF